MTRHKTPRSVQYPHRGDVSANLDDWSMEYRGPREIDEADRQESTFGLPYSSCYWHILGSPPSCSPRDYHSAAMFVAKIRQAIDQGNWKSSENRRLHLMLAKWGRRAAGRDARFNVVGNRSGGLTEEEQAQLRDERSHIRLMEDFK